MKRWFYVSLLLAATLSITGCKKTKKVKKVKKVKKSKENGNPAVNEISEIIKVNGKEAKKMTAFYPGSKQKAAQTIILNGKPHGKSTHWHKNGKLKHIQFWKNGKRVGVWTFYKEDGTVGEKVDYDKMKKEPSVREPGVKEPKARKPVVREPGVKKKPKTR